MERNSLIVHKVGATTQLTTGRLIEMRTEPPRGWYDSPTSSLSDELDFDENEWIGVVEWIGILFSAPGDSGSLVFALEDGITIPLGIHVGAKAEKSCSFFISLETTATKRTRRDVDRWMRCAP
ncbi:hypothetical protein BJX68DRAFT_212071 [Aspergillus pseudodeflectus]|uniref:Uncharacterized protein n=1 Tax=Aspergillus pseudodeflectus TaxID=176178 RepID=A0ABR4JFH4_9EURO